MKKLIFAAIAIFLSFGISAKNVNPIHEEPIPAAKVEDKINWISWDEAVKLNEKNPKKFVIDVYTEWCGWCKRMDKDIFSDAKIAKFVNENFYAVKLDAEQKPEINFGGKTYKFVAQGRSGFHEFAATLLDGNMGYPTLVYLSEKFERTVISPGYKDVPTLMKELRFTAEEYYKKGTWDEFMSKSK